MTHQQPAQQGEAMPSGYTNTDRINRLATLLHQCNPDRDLYAITGLLIQLDQAALTLHHEYLLNVQPLDQVQQALAAMMQPAPPMVVCPRCRESVRADQIIPDPPRFKLPRSLLVPPAAVYEGESGHVMRFIAPGQLNPVGYLYRYVGSGDEHAAYFIPAGTSDMLPYCYLCWVGAIVPAMHQYLSNKPRQLVLHGFSDPTWKD